MCVRVYIYIYINIYIYTVYIIPCFWDTLKTYKIITWWLNITLYPSYITISYLIYGLEFTFSIQAPPFLSHLNGKKCRLVRPSNNRKTIGKPLETMGRWWLDQPSHGRQNDRIWPADCFNELSWRTSSTCCHRFGLFLWYKYGIHGVYKLTVTNS